MTMTTQHQWESWIGRTQVQRDMISRARLAKWLATFDTAQPEDGTVPQGYHWCLCTPDAPLSSLGEDGHPKRTGDEDSFMPPVPLPRRMWASSTIKFLRPLRIGDAISRTSRIDKITEKQGGSGRLTFVELSHDICSHDETILEEAQTIVYREAAPYDAPLSPAPPASELFDPSGWDAHVALTPREPLLFRYSALTFNSHRIHYDLPYAQNEERYRGLVVHGPLTATLLLNLARRHFGGNALQQFSFRGLSPAIAGEPLHLVLRKEDGLDLAAFAQDGRQVMQATAMLAN